jgi:hypothetical protein
VLDVTPIKAMASDKRLLILESAQGGDSFINFEIDRYLGCPGQAIAYKIGGARVDTGTRGSPEPPW